MNPNVNNSSSAQSVIAQPSQVDFSTSRPNVPVTLNANKSQCHNRDQVVSHSARRGRYRRGGPPHRSDVQLDVQSVGSSAASAESAKIGSPSGGANRKRGGRSLHGKYRQRQQTNQLIEGIDGLDIDLVESVAPTDSTCEQSSSGRNRHATNNRKVNLTHLLNYRYERKSQRANRRRDNSESASYNRGNYHPYKDPYKDFDMVHKFSKQQFLQANCQFVVLDGHDYTVHKVDPDWPVDWDCIEEIKFKQSASTETTCPICLEPPIAAKITKCGHIYCWTCMLQYLSLSDESCRQCPICFEAVYGTDLRSVVSHSFVNHSVGEEIVMRLMIRKKGCVEVEPYSRVSSPGHLDETNEEQSNRCENSTSEHYCSQDKLVIVDPRTVISKIIQRERDELLFKMELESDAPEVCFVEQALDWLDTRVTKLNGLIETNRKLAKRASIPANDDIIEPSKSYLFYQCADGQHIYLNPFSTKMMCHEYSSMENCPLEIRAKILQMNWVSMSEQWRKRFKYLAHLPLTCEFRLIEIDLDKSNLVSRETYKAYEEKILARANERERRLREERKREKIIQVEQNRRIYGIQPTLEIDLNSIDQFPTVSDERYLGLSSRPSAGQTRADYEWSDDDEVAERSSPSEAVSLSTGAGNAEQSSNEPHNDTSANRSDGAINGPQDVTAKMTLSFAEIQLQEAAKEAASARKSTAADSKAGAVGWGSKRAAGASSGTGGQSSSFAKMVVDAKASQKGWTRSVSSTLASHQSIAGSQTSQQTHNHRSQRTRRSTNNDDDNYEDDSCGEELRAPPSEFTISDFMEMNVVSGSSKRKSTKSKKQSAK